jgi:hypothetical protein
LALQLATARVELTTLQGRYDALRADRDRLAQRLEKHMKTYKHFGEWILIKKGSVPPKATHVTDPGVERASGSTPVSQQQHAVQMLETPITPTSLSFLYSLIQGYQC